MSNPNTPNEVAESKNTPKKEKKYNIASLIKEGIGRKFGSPFQGKEFNQYQKSANLIHDDIRLYMRDIRNENQEEWSDIPDEIIDKEASNERISQDIAHMSKNLIFKRKRLIGRSVEIFPLVKNQNNWKNIIATHISDLNENDLNTLVMRTASLRKMLGSIFAGVDLTDSNEKRNFDKIFYDKDVFFDENTKARLEKIHKNYNYGYNIPDGGDIDFILEVYKNAPDTRKKELLSDFSVTLTIKEAYHLGLIDTNFLEVFAKNEFENIYSNLSLEQKNGFVRGLAQDESYVISAEDFDEVALGNIFSDNKKRRTLSQEVFRSVAIDMPESEKSTKDSILGRIKNKKQKEALETGVEENYDIYDEFVEQLKLEKKKGSPIKNIDILRTKDAVIQFKHPNGSNQYMRILAVRDDAGSPLDIRDGETYGIQCETLNITNNALGAPQKLDLDYDMFQRFLFENQDVSILTSEEFEGLLVDDMSQATKETGKIFDARTIESDPVTALNIVDKLNMLDPDGVKYGFEKGTAFMAPLKESHGDKVIHDAIWTISKINPNNTVDLFDVSGRVAETQLPLDQVYNVLRDIGSTFKRIAKIPDDTEMQNHLKDFGVGKIKDGKLYVQEKDDHGHELDKHIACFQGKTPQEHIRMEYIEDGRVSFGEYKAEENITDIKAHTKKNGLDKTIKSKYKWQTMSYASFLKYLAKNKLKATTNDSIIDTKAGHDHHHESDHHHPHVHGSFMSRIFQMQNISSIWKGFEMIVHGIEHTLEKGAKLDAAKFALRTANFLHLPDSVKAQIYSDVVTGSKEILEKIEKKIFDLPGPAGRLKCLHIIENHDSRPEEIAAAMNYMLKSYGHLYAEDMKHKQSIIQNQEHFETAPNGTFMFFDAFVSTAKLGDLHTWRKKAYKKAIGEMGSADDHDGEPTEEQLIHALFKDLDGDWDKFPYAASVLKALGGPGGFEKTWKFEGYENAKKKGVDQTKMVSPQGRLNKAIGYLGSHEIYKGIGAMEAVVAKAKSPEFQAFPFVWAVGGFSRYASQTALQDIKGYSEGGYSFHAYAFMKTPAENIMYKKVVRLALREKGGQSLVDDFDNICKRLEFNPDKEKATKDAALDMMKLWQKHCGGENGLHDMLQGHNGWLLKGIQDGNPDISNYLKNLHGKHDMQLKGESISSDKMQDQYHEWGYRQNRIVGYDEKKGVMSLRKTLNKIKLGGGTKIGDRQMSDDDRDKLWGGIGEHMDSTRNIKGFQGDIDLQKKQFLHFRREIIDFYVANLNARSGSLAPADIEKILTVLPHKYYKDIANMGIDPRSLFDANLDKNNEESDFQRWKKGIKYVAGSSQALDLASFIQGKTQNATNYTTGQNSADSGYRQSSTDYDLRDPGGAPDEFGYDGD